MPPVAEVAEARRVQILERSFWLRRDLAQAATLRQACLKQAALVALIDANNEVAGNE